MTAVVNVTIEVAAIAGFALLRARIVTDEPGGKLTGAGGGGFLLLFVAPERQAAVLEALDGLLNVPFEFESAGSQIIFYEPGVDYREAERARRHQSRVCFKELAHAKDEDRGAVPILGAREAS